MNSYHEVCVCGRSFSQQGAYNHHKRTCQQSRKRLSSALAAAKEVWSLRKRHRGIQGVVSTTETVTPSNPIEEDQVRLVMYVTSDIQDKLTLNVLD